MKRTIIVITGAAVIAGAYAVVAFVPFYGELRAMADKGIEYARQAQHAADRCSDDIFEIGARKAVRSDDCKLMMQKAAKNADYMQTMIAKIETTRVGLPGSQRTEMILAIYMDTATNAVTSASLAIDRLMPS